jgi:hypothetical protein
MPMHFGKFIETQDSPGLLIVSQRTNLLNAIEELVIIWTASEAEEYRNTVRTISL